MDEALTHASAVDLARRVRAKEVSAVELTSAFLERIEAANPALNAIVTLDAERALERARQADQRLARGDALGPLHGLPIAHKDLVETAGLRTTFGSPLFRDYVPRTDASIVVRLREAGAICVGKTNTPEFGAGSQTFNPIFGATRNPWDPTRTCGGSSGGAAAALAAGMLPIADGSDLGGSLRNPASFCNVVGFRVSAGRVPVVPEPLAFTGLGVLGPMARSTEDVALLLSAMAGPDARSPLSLPEPGAAFAPPLGRDFAGVRVAWSRDLDGLPVDPAVRRALEPARAGLERIGCVVEDAEPPLADADRVFHVLRAYLFAARMAGASDEALAACKDTVRWNVAEGRALSAVDVGEAEAARTRLFYALQEFMDTWEFIAAPVVQVPPFDVETEWVREIDGVKMETYIDWMKSCCRISVSGHPAISVPSGFTEDGLPVGLQIVGRYRDDRGVLELAHAFERVAEASGHCPP